MNGVLCILHVDYYIIPARSRKAYLLYMELVFIEARPSLNSQTIDNFRWTEINCYSFGNVCQSILCLPYSFLRTLERFLFSRPRTKWNYVLICFIPFRNCTCEVGVSMSILMLVFVSELFLQYLPWDEVKKTTFRWGHSFRFI